MNLVNLTNETHVLENHCYYHKTTNIEVRYYTVLIFGTFLCIVAFFESVFLFYLLTTREKFRNSTLFYLAILSVFDIFLSPFWVLLQSVPILYDYYEWLELYYAFLSYSPSIFTISLSLLSASEYLILFASFENFLKTRFHWRQSSKLLSTIETNRGKVCMCASVWAVLLQMSHYWELEVVAVPNCTGFAAYALNSLQLTNNPLFDLIWTFYLRNIFDVFIPFFLLLVFNTCIMISLKKKGKEQRDSLISGNLEINLESRKFKASTKAAVRALISDVLEYLISNVLNVVLAFWETFAFSNLVNYHMAFYDNAADMVNILTVLFRALRLPIYCFCNKDIRMESLKELTRLFPPTVTAEPNKFGPGCDENGMILARQPPDILMMTQPDRPDILMMTTTNNNTSEPPSLRGGQSNGDLKTTNSHHRHYGTSNGQAGIKRPSTLYEDAETEVIENDHVLFLDTQSSKPPFVQLASHVV